MILKTTIATNKTRSVPELESRLPDTHLFQYFVSKINSSIVRKIIREIVARAPPCEIISIGKDVCVFETRATNPILLLNPLLIT